MRMIPLTLLLTLFSSSLWGQTEVDRYWPQWRGPDGTGTVSERDVPNQWSGTSNVRWKADIAGFGASTPCVWDQKIFLTTQVDENLRALCLDRDSGKVVWDRKVGSGVAVRKAAKGETKFHRLHNLASPSPVTDGKHVYFHFGNGDLVGFTVDGEEIWKRNLAEDYGEYTIWWGHANSPVLFEDLIISVCMQDPIHGASSYLVAHDKRTGKLRWHTARDTGAKAESADSYTTPLLQTRDGHAELIVMGGNVVDAYDPATGTRRWNVTGLEGGRTITGPVVGDGMVFVTRGMRGALVALKPTASDSAFEPAWTHTTSTPDTPCPVYLNGLIFTITDNGIGTCLDAQTGEVCWRERLGGDFKASPIAVGDRLFFQNLKGVTTIVRADRTFQKIAENSVDEETIASLAVAGDQLFLRTGTQLWCVEQTDQ